MRAIGIAIPKIIGTSMISAIIQFSRSMKMNIIRGTTIAWASSKVLWARKVSILSTSSNKVVLICPGACS